MGYSNFYYSDVDRVIYFGKRDLYRHIKKKLEPFKVDYVHNGLGYCPCWSRNSAQQPNMFVHLFKDCASVIYVLSCFSGSNDSKQKLILAHDQDPLYRGVVDDYCLAKWSKQPNLNPRNPGTLVVRIDYVHIKPDIVKHKNADCWRDGIADIKRDWRKSVYGLVGVRRPVEEQEVIEEDYPPAGMVFCRDHYDDDISDDQRKLLVTADGQLLLNGPFIPLVIHQHKNILLDIDLSCSVKSSEQTVTLDVFSYFNYIPGFSKCIEIDKTKTCSLDGLNGAVTVGYSIITMAVYKEIAVNS